MGEVSSLYKALYEEAEKLWKIVQKNAYAVEEADGNLAAWLLLCARPVCLVRGRKKVTVEEKEEGGFTYVKNYTDEVEVDVARLNGRLYLFVLERTRISGWDGTERKRYVALVDIERGEFKQELSEWLFDLPLPRVEEGEKNVGRKVIEFTEIVDGKVQVTTVRRTAKELIIHVFKLPNVEIKRTYSLP